VGALLTAGLLQRWGRAQVLTVTFTAGVPLLAFAVLVRQARHLGFVAQSRYYLPLLLGVPALAVIAGQGRGRLSAGLRRLAVPLATGTVVVQVFAFLFSLRRHRTGVDHALWVWHAAWEPPIPALALLVVFALASTTFAAVVVATFTERRALTARHRLEYRHNP
jgi:hypothetical protein